MCDWIAELRVRLEQLRLLVLKDRMAHGPCRQQGGAHTEIQVLKIATPATVQRILDKAIQVHAAGGLSQDFPLANAYAKYPRAAVRRRSRRGPQERAGEQ